MASVKFLLKSKAEKSKVYVRFTDGRSTDFIRATIYEVEKRYWKDKDQRIGNYSAIPNRDKINSDLRLLEGHLLDSYIEDYKNGIPITSAWYKKTILKFFNREVENGDLDLNLFVNYGKKFVEKLPYKRNGLSDSIGRSARTIKHYENAINKVRRFNQDIRVSEIDSQFESNFVQYLFEKEGLGKGTVGRMIKFVKTICHDAQSAGLKTHPELHQIKGFSSKSRIIYLDEDEIEKVRTHGFDQGSYLDNARDWLIVGLSTGQRIGDFMSFAKPLISDDGFIEFAQQKTKKKTVVPISKNLQEVLDKHEGGFPRKISHPRFNEYIKIVCEKAGVNEEINGTLFNSESKKKEEGMYPKSKLVSSHICRRSFATNHYGKIPTPIIMSITNHSTEKQFLEYIGKTQKDHAQQMKDYWKSIENDKV